MKIKYDNATRSFLCDGMKMFAKPPKPPKPPKPNGGGGNFESDRRTRLIKFDYVKKKHMPSYALSKLRMLNGVLAAAYEDGFINDFFPVNDYNNVYVEGTKGDAFDIEINDSASGVHPITPTGIGLKFKVSYYNIVAGKYIGTQDLTVEEIAKWLKKTSEMTQREREDNWKRVGKFAARISKGVDSMFKAFFEEREPKY
jgi:hypothetical protein